MPVLVEPGDGLLDELRSHTDGNYSQHPRDEGDVRAVVLWKWAEAQMSVTQ